MRSSIFLRKRFSQLHILPWGSLKNEIKEFDIIINATSLGLKDGMILISIFKYKKKCYLHRHYLQSAGNKNL